MHFILEYGQEEDIPMEFLVLSLRIVVMIDLIDSDTTEERLS